MMGHPTVFYRSIDTTKICLLPYYVRTDMRNNTT
jgi:hypothetical protein